MNEGGNDPSRNNQMIEDMSSNGVCLTEVVTGPDEGDDEMTVDLALKRNNSTLQQNFKP